MPVPTGTNLAAMSGLLARRRHALRRGLPHAVLGLLHAAGGVGAPAAPRGPGHAGRDRAAPGRPWPGAGVGIRPPGPGETPLTLDEIAVALRYGVRL